MTSDALRAFALITALMLLGACDRGLSSIEYRRIDEWLGCHECWNGERGLVRAIGPRAVPRLTEGVRNGLSASRIQILRNQFAAEYSPAPDISRDEYADSLLSNVIATHQIRAAVSLADIGGTSARNALDEALRDSISLRHRGDVTNAIQIARARLDDLGYRGQVSPSVVAFGDTVQVTAPPGVSFSGTERAEFDEAPFGPDLTHRATNSTGLTFTAVGDAREHVLRITNVGPALETQIATFAIRSLQDQTDRSTAACEPTSRSCAVSSAMMAEPTAGNPVALFLALWRSPITHDTIDIIKIIPTSAATYTATIDWRPASPPPGPGVEFGWRPCGPFVLSGSGSFGTVPTQFSTSRAIGAGECMLLITKLRAGPSRRIFAQVRIETP